MPITTVIRHDFFQHDAHAGGADFDGLPGLGCLRFSQWSRWRRRERLIRRQDGERIELRLHRNMGNNIHRSTNRPHDASCRYAKIAKYCADFVLSWERLIRRQRGFSFATLPGTLF